MTALEKMDALRIKKKAEGKAREAQIIAQCMAVLREYEGKPQVKTEWRKLPSHWAGLIK